MDFRMEHPRPDLCREEYLSLNGVWDFEVDNALVGESKKYFERDALNEKINVPFCPESKLSGLGYVDFMNGVWYRRNFELPANFAGKRVLLHFEACDYLTKVYVNGVLVGTHKGGYTPFVFDITDALRENGNYVTVFAQDDTRSSAQMSGKQSERLESYGCFYTRTTGIWQSVWLEAAPKARVERYEVHCDIENSSVALGVETTEWALGARLEAKVYFEGALVGEGETVVAARKSVLTVALSELNLWDLGQGNLYDVVFTLTQPDSVDTLRGYFGMRDIRLTKKGFYLNGRCVYGRFVLDQGFYPDGIYTAPSDAALKADIQYSMSLGFNGARLHQKVFESRFLYHADKMGYMVFDETPNWGLDHTEPMNIYNFVNEWLEEVKRDMAHPCVIGWCPFNETWDRDGRRQSNSFIDTIYDVTLAVDSSRPIVTNSGSYPCKSDMHDVHDYEQEPAKFKEYYAKIPEGVICDQIYRKDNKRQWYDTAKPVFVSEYGGIKWIYGAPATEGWGYGKSVQNEEEFMARLKGLTDVLLDNENICAFCYTQLTDVEQEQNGLMTYDRVMKFDPASIAKIISKKAAIED